MQDKPFLTPAEVAAELDVSPSTVLRMIHSGRLPAIAVSERIYRIPADSLALYRTRQLSRLALAPLGARRSRPRMRHLDRLALSHGEAGDEEAWAPTWLGRSRRP
jgi:excisionase family DNA binding protein